MFGTFGIEIKKLKKQLRSQRRLRHLENRAKSKYKVISLGPDEYVCCRYHYHFSDYDIYAEEYKSDWRSGWYPVTTVIKNAYCPDPYSSFIFEGPYLEMKNSTQSQLEPYEGSLRYELRKAGIKQSEFTGPYRTVDMLEWENIYKFANGGFQDPVEDKVNGGFYQPHNVYYYYPVIYKDKESAIAFCSKLRDEYIQRRCPDTSYTDFIEERVKTRVY